MGVPTSDSKGNSSPRDSESETAWHVLETNSRQPSGRHVILLRHKGTIGDWRSKCQLYYQKKKKKMDGRMWPRSLGKWLANAPQKSTPPQASLRDASLSTWTCICSLLHGGVRPMSRLPPQKGRKEGADIP